MSSTTTTQTPSIPTATIHHERKGKEDVDSQRVLNKVEKYHEAWKQKGIAAQNDLLVGWYRPKQNDMVQPRKHRIRSLVNPFPLSPNCFLSSKITSRADAFMNSWNSKQVHSFYPSQSTARTLTPMILELSNAPWTS
jgi:hypothetical protein